MSVRLDHGVSKARSFGQLLCHLRVFLSTPASQFEPPSFFLFYLREQIVNRIADRGRWQNFEEIRRHATI